MRFIARPVTQGACVVPDAVLCVAAQCGVKSETLSTQLTFTFMAAATAAVPGREDEENFISLLKGFSGVGFDREKTGWGSGGRYF